MVQNQSENLFDKSAENTVYNSHAMRKFWCFDWNAPDATAVMHFLPLREEKEFGKLFLM